MKGAIGNAFILNMVITFILIFYLILIGSMAYSKAYKTKNYLLNLADQYGTKGIILKDTDDAILSSWDKQANEYLGKIGYPIDTSGIDSGYTSCPDREDYGIRIGSKQGRYNYCVYVKFHEIDEDYVTAKYNYMVLVYMKFDFPVIGKYIKIPITGETKTYYTIK